MSAVYSLAQRTFAHNGLFAGIACAVALTMTAGPAFAQSPLDRVEVNSRGIEAPTRFDVRESCVQAEPTLQKSLQSTWSREHLPGNVDVRFVVTNGEVQAVQASGMSAMVHRDVRRAVRQLSCTGAQAGTSIYRLRIAFIDPMDDRANTVAQADDSPYRVAGAAVVAIR